MDKLLQFKRWLTLADAAKRLSLVLGEEISVPDLLQLALDRRLQLSVLLVNGAMARAAKLLCDDDKIDDAVDLFFMPSGDGLTMSRQIVTLEGLYDVPMFGAEVFDVSDAYHSATGGPKVTADAWHGAFLTDKEGRYFQLGTIDEQKRNRDGGGLEPARLPKDAVFVVRREELRRFEDALEHEPESSDLSGMPPMLKTLIRAWEKFWRNVDPNDRGLHYTNAEIAEWLVERGYSATLADRCATIIRPEGAPLGRLPKE